MKAFATSGVTTATVLAQVVFVVIWPKIFGWAWTVDELGWLTALVALTVRGLQVGLERYRIARAGSLLAILLAVGTPGAATAQHHWPVIEVETSTATLDELARALQPPPPMAPIIRTKTSTSWWGPRAGVGFVVLDMATGEALPGLSLSGCYGWSYRPKGLVLPTQVAFGADLCVGGGWVRSPQGQRAQVLTALVFRTVMVEMGAGIRQSFGPGGYNVAGVLLAGVPIGLLEPPL